MAAQEEAGAVLKAALGAQQALGERGEASLAGIYQAAFGFLPNPLPQHPARVPRSPEMVDGG